MPTVKIVTVNILNDLSRWKERRSLLAQGLAESKADLIALQEVTLRENKAEWLAHQLGGYDVRFCPQTGKRQEGIAILSRLPIEHTTTLDLRSQHRVAQRVEVNAGGCRLVLVNTHLYWQPGESAERVRQVQLILDWLNDTPSDAAVAVCGDFNGVPDSAAIRLMRQHLTSAYAARHGREPDYTCPTSLKNQPTPKSILRGIASPILNLVANHTLKPWHGTVDYIFVNEYVHVVECKVVLNRPAPSDAALYPSDHFGLAATLEIR